MSQDPLQADFTAKLQAECQRLQQLVKCLEAAVAEGKQERALIELERDGYRRFLEMFANVPSTAADMEKVLRDNDCQTLDEFLPELEKVVR